MVGLESFEELGIYWVKDTSVPDHLRGTMYWDAFDSFIVAARDKEDALRVVDENKNDNGGFYNSTNIEVVTLGEASISVRRGIILGSWNSTG